MPVDKERGLHAAPSVTTRVSIRWVRMQRVLSHLLPSELTHMAIIQGNDDPEENTSTLVLTSPSGLFVDLRIVADCMPDADPENFSTNTTIQQRTQNLGAIDWAFAGRSLRQPARPDGVMQACWIHWVDSRTVDALSVHDSGLCRPLPNGDELEWGEMQDPTGVMRPYEEIWHDEPVTSPCAAVFVCSRNASALSSASAKSMVTIPPHEVCGMIVRVGTWLQGILREIQHNHNEHQRAVTVERWSLANNGVWKCKFRAGEYIFPLNWVHSTSISSSQQDLSFLDGDLYWKCVELYEEGTIAKEQPS